MEYRDFLKNKRVAVVGPSLSIEGCGSGKLVDSYDVVVRMVRPRTTTEIIPPRLFNDIGVKTDVIYSNFDESIPLQISCAYLEQIKDRGVMYFNSTLPVQLIAQYPTYDQRMKEVGILSCNVSKAKHEEWSKQVKSSPHSGFCVLLDLLSYSIKELFILGFSFYKDLVISEWLAQNNWSPDRYIKDIEEIWKEGEKVSLNDNSEDWKRENTHNNNKELVFFIREILSKDKRVKIDKSLEKFFQI